MRTRTLFSQYRNQIQLGLAIIFTIFGLQKVRKQRQAAKMDKVSKQKRAICQQQLMEYKKNIHIKSSLPLELQKKIIDSNITQLQQLLLDGETSVRQLLLVFIDRVLKMACSDNLNLITEINFISALEEADLQDQEIRENPLIIKQFPLFGIPISVKETYLMKDFDSTVGVGSRCFKPSEMDGTQVAQIRKAKGIIFAMTYESTNPIYGRSLNPWNCARAVGGSSGGEGAMAAARCSVVGMGSDLGGSLRIPAAFCGVYAFKPSASRVPEQGEAILSSAFQGQQQLRISRGPIGRCVNDLIIMTKLLFDKNVYSQIPYKIKDPYFEPKEFNNQQKKNKLRIGYFEIFDDLMLPNCMKRGVRKACEALQQKGHEIVKFIIDPEIEHSIACSFMKIMTADGGMKSVTSSLNGQNYIKEHELLILASNIPYFIKKYLLGPLYKLFGQYNLFRFNVGGKIDVYQYLRDSGMRKQMNIKFIQAMTEQGIDALISPGFALPAVKHGSSRELGFATYFQSLIQRLYTWIFNVLELPAGSLPITLVQEGDDIIIEEQEHPRDLIYIKMRKNMIGAQGLPVNVQVSSYPMQDEMVLRVMKEIEGVINFNHQHPYPE